MTAPVGRTLAGTCFQSDCEIETGPYLLVGGPMLELASQFVSSSPGDRQRTVPVRLSPRKRSSVTGAAAAVAQLRPAWSSWPASTGAIAPRRRRIPRRGPKTRYCETVKLGPNTQTGQGAARGFGFRPKQHRVGIIFCRMSDDVAR
jgi:hypothetical protein